MNDPKHAASLLPDLSDLPREMRARLRPALEGPVTAGLDVLTFGLVGWGLLICL